MIGYAGQKHKMPKGALAQPVFCKPCKRCLASTSDLQKGTLRAESSTPEKNMKIK